MTANFLTHSVEVQAKSTAKHRLRVAMISPSPEEWWIEMEDRLAMEHEKLFVDSFVVPKCRQRYLQKLSSRKSRRQFLDRLNHKLGSDLDDRFLVKEDRAWPHHVPRCYLIADEEQFDGRVVTAADALVILGEARFGLIVSFVPGKLACYQAESPSGLFWLER